MSKKLTKKSLAAIRLMAYVKICNYVQSGVDRCYLLCIEVLNGPKPLRVPFRHKISLSKVNLGTKFTSWTRLLVK